MALVRISLPTMAPTLSEELAITGFSGYLLARASRAMRLAFSMASGSLDSSGAARRMSTLCLRRVAVGLDRGTRHGVANAIDLGRLGQLDHDLGTTRELDAVLGISDDHEADAER